MEWWVYLLIALGVAAVIVIVLLIVLAAGKKKGKADGEEAPVEDEDDGQSAENKQKKSPASKVYHIAKRKSDGKWQVKAAGAEKALKLFDTQAEAIEYAKQVAGNQEAKIMIHKEDGSFRRLSYK